MLKIELLKDGKFSINEGSSVLRMMQNNSTPSLDLIVRESIQNSLDATQPNNYAEKKPVIVGFTYGNFDNEMLCQQFEGINKQLFSITKEYDNKFLAIRDSNTVGLTGSLNHKIKKGEIGQNLSKLVFNLLKHQDQEGAGGSWGLGKTVYFRIGIGLVIYYSRIKKDNGEFEERMAATLVEDETNQNGVLADYKDNTGIAFFGEDDKLEGGIQATTNIDDISSILNCFGILRYGDNETGTTIIIPYIYEKEVLGSNKDEHNDVWWQDSIENYLKVSIVRWYFPRMNKSYMYGPRLLALVNNKIVEPDENDMPVFSKFSELYYACNNDDFPSWISKEKIIRNTNLATPEIGCFCYGKVTSNELKILSNYLPNPYQYTMLDNEDRNSPLIAFTRKPGMVVNYQINDCVKTKDDEFIIGVFSLNSNNSITKPKNVNLDEYVRQCEKADHADWEDHELEKNSYKVRIIRTIEKEIKSILINKYGDVEVSKGDENINTNFAKMFGKLLLPDESFGKTGSKKPTNSNNKRTGGRKRKTRNNNVIDFTQRTFEKGYIITEYRICLNNYTSLIKVMNCINTINGGIDPSTYVESGLKYPCNINKIMVKIISKNKREVDEHPIMLNLNDDDVFEYFNVYVSKTDESISGFKFEKNEKDFFPMEFIIRIMTSSNDKFIQTYFDFVMEGE